MGWGAGLQASRLVQSKGSNPLRVLQQEYKVIYLMYKSAKFGLVLTVTYLQIYIYSSVKAYQPTLLFPIAMNFEDHTVRLWIWRNVDKKQCVTQKPTRS